MQERSKSRPALMQRIDRLTLFGRRWPVVLGVGMAAFALGVVALAILSSSVPKADPQWRLSMASQCDSGRIADLAETGFLKSLQALDDDGVAGLAVCDDQVFDVPASEMPSAMAQAYAGCLSFDAANNTLSMRANPKAICRSEGRLFCMGQSADAKDLPAPRDLVALADLPVCPNGGPAN